MHDGCSGSFTNGKQVADKVRAMGFAGQFMPVPLDITCQSCDTEFAMQRYEDQCPKCRMVYAVTPCHAFDPKAVQPAGVDY